MSETPQVALIYTTWPDEESAIAAASALLEDRLIACANVSGAVRSVYRWEGEVRTETEIACLFKTAEPEACAARIAALHPYDEPAIVRLSVDPKGSAAGFLAWVENETL